VWGLRLRVEAAANNGLAPLEAPATAAWLGGPSIRRGRTSWSIHDLGGDCSNVSVVGKETTVQHG
jgi:hypothetical protein